MAASKAESSAPGSKPATISKGQGDVVCKDLGHDMTQRQLHNAVGNEPQSHAGRVALVTGEEFC